MLRLTITAKGQVTLNKKVLEHLRLKPGDKIEVDLKPQREISIVPARKGKPIDSMIGLLHAPEGPKLTLEEIKEAIEEGWAGIR